MNYIAYTIGPIYDTIFDTLNVDNKTKKLYAGSYYFSYFMKVLLKSIKDDFNVIVPFIDNNILDKNYNMGLFHDRFIAQSEKSKEDMKNIFERKLQEVFVSLAKEIENESISQGLINSMDNHLIIATKEELQNIDANIIFALNKILDSKELQRSFSFEQKKNYIQTYQEQFVKDSNKRVKTIETLSGDFGYYAVITADGDKMGAKIQREATEDPVKIKELSKKLFHFFTDEKDIYEITNNIFNGELIYAGGDDILAFLSVKSDKGTFLDYVKVLDKRFKESVGDDVSFSFGVNIAYYKYPLRDAIKKSFDLLHKAKESGENSIALNITKHSGQTFETVFKLKEDKYANYKEIIDGVLNASVVLPHSLHHSLKRYEEAIISTFQESRTIDALFETLFNDEKDKKAQESLGKIKEYLNLCKPKSKKEFDDIFSQLSLVKFLREDRK